MLWKILLVFIFMFYNVASFWEVILNQKLEGTLPYTAQLREEKIKPILDLTREEQETD